MNKSALLTFSISLSTTAYSSDKTIDFEQLNEHLKNICKISAKDYNINEDDCRNLILRNTKACITKAKIVTLETINTSEKVRYAMCVSPKPRFLIKEQPISP